MTDSMDRRIVRSPWRRRITIGVVAAAVATAGAALTMTLGGTRSSLRVPANSVTIDTVQQAAFRDLTALRGNVTPRETYYLAALEGGQVERILAKAGDRVTAGQPLLVFRNSQLQLAVLEREGRLVESITQLQVYEKSLEDTRLADLKAAADIDYNIVRLERAAARRKVLVAKGFVSQEVEDQLRDELAHYIELKPIQARTNARKEQLMRQQIPQIRADTENLKRSLEIARRELDALTVRAPVTGQLTSLVQNVGQNFNRGDRIGEVVPNTGSKVAASVDEYYLGRVRVGQSASVRVNGQDVTLAVERIYPEVKNGVFTVDLAFVGRGPAGLSPGQAVEGDLTLGGDRPALVAPAGAFLERSGGAWVMVVNARGDAAERRNISIGRRSSRQVEILGGLKPGERVITSDYTGFEKIGRLVLTR